MDSAGTGNTEPLWLPRNIVQDATLTFKDISWYSLTPDPKDQTVRNCLKYGRDCTTGENYKIHTQNLNNMVIIYKWNKTYLNAEFVYNNRPCCQERFNGSNVVFLKNGSEVDRFHIGSTKDVHKYKTNKEFDQINVHFSKNYQNFVSIEVNVKPQ
jgi:hypothetical protein